jgi:hypothetical protein
MNFDANPNAELQNLCPVCLSFLSNLSVGFQEIQKLHVRMCLWLLKFQRHAFWISKKSTDKIDKKLK